MKKSLFAWSSALLVVMSCATAAESTESIVVTGNYEQLAAEGRGDEIPAGVALGNNERQKEIDALAAKKKSIKLAIAFLEAKRTSELIDKTWVDVIEQQVKALPEMEKYRSVLEEFYRKELSFDNLKTDLAELYVKHLTDEELVKLTEFFSSEVGQKLAATEISLSADIMRIMLLKQQEKMSVLAEKLKAASKK